MQRYQAILFDFDGVLADTEPMHFACWAQVLRPLGIDLDWDTFQRHGVGLTDLALIEFLARQAEPHRDVEIVRAAIPQKQQLFVQRVLENPPIPEATVSLLKRLYNYKLAVVTSSSRLEVEPVLARVGLGPLFGALVCGKEAAQPKPAPDPYLLAARKLGANTALVVEDSKAGVASGRAAGFDVLCIPKPARLPELLLAALDEPKIRTSQAPPPV